MTTMERFRRVAFGVCLCLGSVVPAVASPVVYNNGPIGGLDAWNISNPYSVSDSFILSELTNLDKVRIGLWSEPGQTPLSLNWSIGTTAFGTEMTALASATLTTTFVGTDPNFGYSLWAASFDVTGPMLNAGTYWLTLLNTQPIPIYWDESNGPSTAFQMVNGVPGMTPVGSNSFQLFGTSPGSGTGGDVPEPGTLALAAIAAIALAAQRRQRS